MSDVSYLDNSYALRPPHFYGLAKMAKRAAARDESVPAAGVAQPYAHPFKPYTYRGTGRDELTAFMDDEPETAEGLSRRQERMQAIAGLRLWDGDAPTPPPGYVTAPQAAEMLGVSRRTIERYKRDLAAATAERTGRAS